MSGSVLSTLRAVFLERNILVLSGTNCLYQIFNAFWQLWWSLYLLEEMQAPLPVVGLLSTVQSVSNILFQWPGGMLADRIGRKRVIVLGTSMRIVAPLIMFLAPTWHWVVPGMMLNAAASLYMPAFNAIIADSLPHERRGTAFGAYRMVTATPQIAMPIVSGIYMDTMGIGPGVRLGLLMYMAAAAVVVPIRALFLVETLSRDDIQEGSSVSGFTLSALRSNLAQFRGTLLAMLAAACVSGFSARMVYPFLVVYGVEVIGLHKAEWGALQTIAMGISTPLYLFGGMVADRFGRVPCILLAMSVLPLESIGLLFLRDFGALAAFHAVLGIEGGLGGGSLRAQDIGGPAWQALIADIVPRRDRGKVIGLMATLTGLINIPAPIAGAYIWENIGPNILLGASGILGFMSVPIIISFIREPKTRQQ